MADPTASNSTLAPLEPMVELKPLPLPSVEFRATATYPEYHAVVSWNEHGGSVEWDWSDWLGFSTLIVVLLLVVLALVALRRGAAPLLILGRVSQAARLVLRIRS